MPSNTRSSVLLLKEFYAKAAEATALLQQKAEPEIFDSPYKGMQSENGGVVGMLEVIQGQAKYVSDSALVLVLFVCVCLLDFIYCLLFMVFNL